MSALHDILHRIVDLARDARQIDHSQIVKDLHTDIDEHETAEADAAAKAQAAAEPTPVAPDGAGDGQPAGDDPAAPSIFQEPVQHG